MIPWEEDIIIYNFVSCFFVWFKRFSNCPKLFGSLHVQSQTTQKQQRRPQGNLSMSHRSSIYTHSIILTIIKNLERGQTQIKVFVPPVFHQTRILKNQEACANTLSMECMEFYHRCSESLTALGIFFYQTLPRYGRDGANYTSRAIFDCYYDPSFNLSVVVDYEPKM